MNKKLVIFLFAGACSLVVYLTCRNSLSESNNSSTPTRTVNVSIAERGQLTGTVGNYDPDKEQTRGGAESEPDSTRLTELEGLLNASVPVRLMKQEWKETERNDAQYLKSSRDRGVVAYVLLKAVSDSRRAMLAKRISESVNVSLPRANRREQELMKERLRNWFDLNKQDRVLKTSFSNDGSEEHLAGEWFDVADSSQIKDKYQYLDMGEITRRGFISRERFADRYEHLFSIQDNPASQ